jgi:acyl-coenzyme A synthetase/AMP-(fatty) acid ligase
MPHGWLRFVGRDDDVISSAGYRIGPAEIEDSLIAHEAVHLAGVVGRPDALRGSRGRSLCGAERGLYRPSDASGGRDRRRM